MKTPSAKLVIISIIFHIITSYCYLFSQVKEESLIEARAIWVTRWDFQTPEDIEKIIKNAVDFNFNIVFFQVRGAGTIYYNSSLEPFALANKKWDPLQCAIDNAHKHGIQLHAWMNVFPGCSGTQPPANTNQLWNAHPDWFINDLEGATQKLNGHYAWISPTHPRVRLHLSKLFCELIQNYDIDGLHLDYIRYPGPGFSYDSASVAVFKRKHGNSPAKICEEWNQFRRDGISKLLTIIYWFTQQEDKDVVLSSAVMRNRLLGRNLYLQDAHYWLSKGIMDFLAPMVYTSNMLLFQNMIEDHIDNSHNRFIFPGIIAREGTVIIKQIEFCRQRQLPGHCLFSYENIFPDHRPNSIAKLLKASSYKYKASIPEFTWKKDKAKQPNIFKISTIPHDITCEDQIYVHCEIKNFPERTQVFLIWDNDNTHNTENQIPMKRTNALSDYYVTAYPIPAQEKGTYLNYQIHIKNKNIYSNKNTVLINSQEKKFFQYSQFGPLVYNAQFIAIDDYNRAWVYEQGRKRIRIIYTNGKEASFSPITNGLGTNGLIQKLPTPCGIAIDKSGIVYVSVNSGKHAIFKYDSKTGQALPGFSLSFWPGEIDVDDNNNLYVAEEDGVCWHIFNKYGKEFVQSPFYGSHINQGIAVNKEGTKVYVACRAEGTVHCWQGRIDGNHAKFNQTDDLAVKRVGLGAVDIDQTGNVYVSQIDLGIVSIFNAQGEFVNYLKGRSPGLIAPRGVAVKNDGSLLYIVEWGIESGMKMQKWVSYKDPKSFINTTF